MNMQSTAVRLFACGKHWMLFIILGMALWPVANSHALTFAIPENSNVVGQVQTTTVRAGDSLHTIGRRYGIGGYEMMEANPGMSFTRPPSGAKVVIPSKFVLPDAPRKGIVINLAEMRLYHYHSGNKVSTYPIGIGQAGWLTPTGTTTIVNKQKNPWWIVPESILRKHAARGKPIPPRQPPGPDNPLGQYKMNLGFKNIVIHGTPWPMGVGLRSSHGCIRMLPEHISKLFYQVGVGTQVRVVHQPQKLGYVGNTLMLEAHLPLSEGSYQRAFHLDKEVNELAVERGFGSYQVKWNEAKSLKKRAAGYPKPIGVLK